VRLPLKSLFLLLILISLLIPISLNAETKIKIPTEYGAVIYQSQEMSPQQIFIIGISHRDAITYLNGDNTPRVQAEVYKIGDWLIHNQRLELLLPEGFFKSATRKNEKKYITLQEGEKSCPSLDMEVLEKIFSNNQTYINAEMLLKQNHPLRLQQVEDKGLYEAVQNGLLNLINCPEDTSHFLGLKSELDYLQERRTAAMLQKIPEIVNSEYRQGNIKNEKAIFTIGLSHLNKIIRYMNEDGIRIYAPLSASNGDKDYIAKLTLHKENFGVTVIIPGTLAGDQTVLKINQLDRIVREYQSRTHFALH
jgi:hypothetical protein